MMKHMHPGKSMSDRSDHNQMGKNRRSHHLKGESSGQAQEQPRSQSSKIMVLVVLPVATLLSSFYNFQVPLPDDHDDNSEYNHELLTGIMEVVSCCIYMVVLPALASKRWGFLVIFVDAAFFVILSYVLLLDINFSFVWLAIFPAMAIVFICTLYFKSHRRTGGGGKVIPRASNVDEKTTGIPVELLIIEKTTFVALIVMDQLPGDAAERFPISQFLLFLSFTVATLTRMVMKLPADAYLGIKPASELLYKTLLLLLLVTAHTVAAEWLGEAVVLSSMPEVIPVFLWFSLHLDRKPGSSSIISVDKMRPHRKGLIALGAVVAALLAYLASSMDESGFSSWCMTISVSCGVSGILTYYLVFMLRQWSCPRQQAAADSSKDDVPSSSMLKLWADALLIAAAALLLLRYLVSLRLGLQQPLQVGKVVRSAEILNDYDSNFLLATADSSKDDLPSPGSGMLHFWANALLIAAVMLLVYLFSSDLVSSGTNVRNLYSN